MCGCQTAHVIKTICIVQERGFGRSCWEPVHGSDQLPTAATTRGRKDGHRVRLLPFIFYRKFTCLLFTVGQVLFLIFKKTKIKLLDISEQHKLYNHTDYSDTNCIQYSFPHSIS